MKIALLQMPFLLPNFPSLGLIQIKGRLKEIFKEKIETRLFYLNFDFHEYFSPELYAAVSVGIYRTLLNEWVFRSEAFDNMESNLDDYYRRFFHGAPKFSPDVLEKIMNLGHFIDQLILKYRLSSYDLVGMNATFSVLPGLAFCRHLKKTGKEIITVMGGAGLYKDMGEAVSRYHPHVDYVCSGSGLISFPQLIKGIMEKDKPAMESIDGIFSADNTGKVGNVGEELDINRNIELDYDDFINSYYKFNKDKRIKPHILMETSRGCYWGKCKFCGLNEDQIKFRVKRSETAIREINHYINKYDCHVEMVDNVMPRSYIKRVLPYLQVPKERYILYEVRGDYSEEEIKILKQANVKLIQPGIESLSTPVLETMNKGVNAFQCINMLKLCIKHGILQAWNLLIGFPKMDEEMYKSLLAAIPRLTHLFPPVHLNAVRFDRFSIYWQESKKYDLDLHPFTVYEYVYPYDKEILSKIAYFFEDRNYESQRYSLLIEYSKEIETLVYNWKKRWHDLNDFPKLTFCEREGETQIYDSREGFVKEYRVTPLEEKILNLLEAPVGIDSIIARFPDENAGNIPYVLDDLDNKDLLFKEKDRYMSLVIRDYCLDEDEFRRMAVGR